MNDEDYSVMLPPDGCALLDDICFQSVEAICNDFINYRHKRKEKDIYETA